MDGVRQEPRPRMLACELSRSCLAVEAPRPRERRVQQLWQVGGGHDNLAGGGGGGGGGQGGVVRRSQAGRARRLPRACGGGKHNLLGPNDVLSTWLHC